MGSGGSRISAVLAASCADALSFTLELFQRMAVIWEERCLRRPGQGKPCPYIGQESQGDEAMQPRILGFVHLARAARAELLQNAIARNRMASDFGFCRSPASTGGGSDRQIVMSARAGLADMQDAGMSAPPYANGFSTRRLPNFPPRCRSSL